MGTLISPCSSIRPSHAAIKAYCAAAANAIPPPSGASYAAYNGAAYPYWFVDTNRNGVVDPGETTPMKFDTNSLRAAFNYQYSRKEPGAWAHNNPYIAQILYDSIEAVSVYNLIPVGVDTTGLRRPVCDPATPGGRCM